MIVELTLNSERKAARTLIEASDLAFEDKVDVMVGIYENERLVATGSRTGNILKMLAVAPDHQGGSTLGDLCPRARLRLHLYRERRAGVAVC